jgi:hypothetical protein
MTDRLHALTVILTHDVREDDATALIDAIAIFRGVLSVKTHVANLDTLTATLRAKYELREKILKIFVDTEERP